MYIPNDYSQNYSFSKCPLWFKYLDTQLNEINDQNSIKVPKVSETTNMKTLF